MQGLDRWKERHPEVWPCLEPADVLVDSMRGRSSTWTRIRLNLRNVPAGSAPRRRHSRWTTTRGPARLAVTAAARAGRMPLALAT